MAGHSEAQVGEEETKSEESLSTKIVVQIEGRSINSLLKLKFSEDIYFISFEYILRTLKRLVEERTISFYHSSGCV